MRYRFGKRCARHSCLIFIAGIGIALVIFDYHTHKQGEQSSKEPASEKGGDTKNIPGNRTSGATGNMADNARDVRAPVKVNSRTELDDSARALYAGQLVTSVKEENAAVKPTPAAAVPAVTQNFNASKINFSSKGNSSTNVTVPTGVENKQNKINLTSSTTGTHGTCYDSPFFTCARKKHNASSANRTFHVAYLHRPNWQRAYVYDFTRCRFSNCVYQGDKITQDTDVVLVYGVRLYDSFTPPKRWPHQLYAFAVWEPPDRIGGTFLTNSSSVWNYAFNLTFTYRLDSDIPAVYFRLKPNPTPQEKRPNYYEIAKHKNRTAVWFVSRCHVPSRRAGYVREMQKYVDVDIFGGCGKKCTVRGDSCTELFPQYKFYLSFENSFCTDYITEKLFKNFVPDRHIIPVVRGGGSYDRYFPEGLFINAARFKSPKDLALHLKELGSDPVRYSQYLARKDSYVIGEVIHEREAGCELCQYLNTRELKPKVYDLKRWYGDGHCKRATEISWPSEQNRH
ncbi:unnamed protein product [Lymnaea stagnalis]|uniref:Fucosyltransferase n=1 Tax=Lymnaea stagnalis TaxID=6523 RepID=A0AAV2H2R8_LYMST